MAVFFSNVLLALVWIFLWEQVDVFHFLQGFAVGYLILYLFRGFLPESGYHRRSFAFVRYLGYFTKENILNSLRVAREVFRSEPSMKPGFLKLDPKSETDLEITWFANTISLIPGTLTVDTSLDTEYLYVHGMFINEPEEARRELLEELEPRILAFLR